MKKRLFSVLAAAAALCLLLSSCGGKTEAGDDPASPAGTGKKAQKSDAGIFVPFVESDGFNPYETETVLNSRMLTLVYDGLVSLDRSYNTVFELADSAASEENAVSVIISSSAKFSDGSFVTAAEIIDSFKLAKKCDAYSERLRNFESAAPSGANAVIFTLSEPDAFAVNCLTFPVIKERGKDEMPLGTGRYYISKDGSDYILLENSHKKNFSPKVSRIGLIEPKTNLELTSGLEIGNICYLYDDLSSGTYTRFNAKSEDVLLNNFVYLGINAKNEVLANPLLRRAINVALNRDDIVSSAFHGHARAASSPFNPSWAILSGSEGNIVNENKTVQELLTEGGIASGNLALKLVVSTGNAFRLSAADTVAAQLTAAGIYTAVTPVAPENLRSALATGEFDLYIGEIKLTDNMDLSELFRGGDCAYGVTEESQELSFARYEQVKSGDCQLIDFVNTFCTELPFIPLCYRTGTVFFPNSLNYTSSTIIENDLFSGIAGWSMS